MIPLCLVRPPRSHRLPRRLTRSKHRIKLDGQRVRLWEIARDERSGYHLRLFGQLTAPRPEWWSVARLRQHLLELQTRIGDGLPIDLEVQAIQISAAVATALWLGGQLRLSELWGATARGEGPELELVTTLLVARDVPLEIGYQLTRDCRFRVAGHPEGQRYLWVEEEYPMDGETS